MSNLRSTLLVMTSAIHLAAQPPAAHDARLLDAVLAAQRHRESAFAQVAVTLQAATSVFHGQSQEPPLATTCKFSMAEGRVLQQIDGVDLDGHGLIAADAKPTAARVDRLLLHGGNTETWNPVAREFRFGAIKFKDPAAAWSLLSPGDLLWSFSGSLRTAVLEQRDLALVEVTGSAPERVVKFTATSKGGLQRFDYSCVEQWGWLAKRVESWDLAEAGLALTYLAEIDAVYETRLGAFPRTGRLTDWRPAAGTLSTYHAVELAFEAPDLIGVDVPATLNGIHNGAEAPEVDPLYSNKSFIAENRIWDRRKLIDDLLRQAGTLTNAAGHLNPWRVVGKWSGPVAGLAAALSLFLRRGGRRRASWLALVTSASLACWSVAGHVRGAATQRAAHTVLAAAPSSMLSHSLCGVDALYALLQASGQNEHGYLRVLRLIRPGHMGTDMATLQRVARTLGVTTRVVDTHDYDAPPTPALIHCNGDHFTLVLHADGDRVEVFDSAIGVVEQSWQDLRRTISRPFMTLATETTKP